MDMNMNVYMNVDVDVAKVVEVVKAVGSTSTGNQVAK